MELRLRRLSRQFPRNEVSEFSYIHKRNTATITSLFSPRDTMLARYLLSSCVRLSVRHKPVLYRSVWTNRAGIWYGGFLLPIPHCVIRKFGYIQKLGYFPLEVCSDASRQVDRVVNNSSSSSSSSMVELVDDTYATVDESWLFTKVGQL